MLNLVNIDNIGFGNSPINAPQKISARIIQSTNDLAGNPFETVSLYNRSTRAGEHGQHDVLRRNFRRIEQLMCRWNVCGARAFGNPLHICAKLCAVDRPHAPPRQSCRRWRDAESSFCNESNRAADPRF